MLAMDHTTRPRRQSTVTVKEQVNHTLSKDELVMLRHTFSLFDRDGDGIITATELGSVLKSLNQGISHADVKALIHEVSNSDVISFDEFVTLMRTPASQPNQSRSTMRRGSLPGSPKTPKTPTSPTTGLFGAFSKKATISPTTPKAPIKPTSKPFSISNLFKKKIVEVEDDVVEDMDPLDEMRQVFKVFDINGDGFVSISEMKNIMSKLGLGIMMNEDELRSLFKLVDKDDDGHINFDEFVQLFSMSS
ncbi:calmodulin [Acrasis kona]|uniref:Calmodulin n=1 Tax=Acrasis kona TaxID=1008807 RepID=A0AAW2Z685_9EUKA